MMQSRTHNCGELRAQHAGEHVKLVGWMENVREVGGSLAFVVLRDFYGTTQIVVETSELLAQIKGYNKESTISVEGTVRERASKNPNQPTGDIEVVPEKIELLGRCRYNSLPFEINRSREADETQRLKYRYLDLRNPAVKKNIILRCNVIAALRKAMMEHDFLEIATPILTALCEKTIAGLQWPNYRSQRWGHEHATFVRPVRWICCLLGEDVVPVSFADVTSGNTTRGHRVLGPGDHVVASPAVYEQVLEDVGVLSAERRREAILAGIAEVEAARPGCHVDTPKKVFEEVINLCEWPTVLVGTFDEEFLKVPHEIICESMLTNQRYFPIYDGEGKLTREFVVVSNSKPENAERVIDGNERVVRARLDDAKFFYEEDLKISLDEFRERLAKVAFQEKLGSVLAKSERIEQLALAIAREAHLGAHLAADAARAARPDGLGVGRPGYHLHRFRQRFCELCEKLCARHLVGRKNGHPAGGYLSGRDGLHTRGRLRRDV